MRPVGQCAQRRAGKRGAQPRQIAGCDGLCEAPQGQCQHLGFFQSRDRAHGASRFRHRPLHGRRPHRRFAGRGGHRNESPRPGLVSPVVHQQRRSRPHRLAMRSRRPENQPPHHQQRRRCRVGPAKPFLQRPHARLQGRLCQLAPQRVGGPDCQAAGAQRRDAARRLVHLDALGRRVGLGRGRGPLRR